MLITKSDSNEGLRWVELLHCSSLSKSCHAAWKLLAGPRGNFRQPRQSGNLRASKVVSVLMSNTAGISATATIIKRPSTMSSDLVK